MKTKLSRAEINNLLIALDAKLKARQVCGELYLLGGAVMCLALNARPSTNDIDAYFVPAEHVREAAIEIAEEHNLDPKWLNDAVKGFLGANGAFDNFLTFPNLSVFVATPEYLLAMKCLSMRIGFEFQDESDVRYLLRYLNITDYQTAVEIISKYYPLAQFPQKTLYVLEELLTK